MSGLLSNPLFDMTGLGNTGPMSTLANLSASRGANAAGIAPNGSKIGSVPIGVPKEFGNNSEKVSMPDLSAPDTTDAMERGSKRAARDAGLDEGGPQSDAQDEISGFHPALLDLAKKMAPTSGDANMALAQAGIGMAQAGSHTGNFLQALSQGAGQGLDYFQKLRAYRAEMAIKQSQLESENQLRGAQTGQANAAAANYARQTFAGNYPYVLAMARKSGQPQQMPGPMGTPIWIMPDGTSSSSPPGAPPQQAGAQPPAGAAPPAAAGPTGGAPIMPTAAPGGAAAPVAPPAAAAARPAAAPATTPAPGPAQKPAALPQEIWDQITSYWGIPNELGTRSAEMWQKLGSEGYLGTDGQHHYIPGSPADPKQKIATATGVAQGEAAARAQNTSKTIYDPASGKTLLASEYDVLHGNTPFGAVPVQSEPTSAEKAMMGQAADQYKSIHAEDPTIEQRKQRLEMVGDVMQNLETGPLTPAIASKLALVKQVYGPAYEKAAKALGYNANTQNPQELSEIMSKNSAQDLAEMAKSAGQSSRLLAEFKTFQSAIQNPSNQPGANQAIVAQSLGALDFKQALNKDFVQRYGQGPMDPDKFQETWINDHPLSSFVQARLKTLPVRGVPFQAVPVGGLGIADQDKYDKTGKLLLKAGDRYMKDSQTHFVPLSQYMTGGGGDG